MAKISVKPELAAYRRVVLEEGKKMADQAGGNTYEFAFAFGYNSKRVAKAITKPAIQTADSVAGQAIRKGLSVCHFSLTMMLRLALKAVCTLDWKS